jgi:hypothetical protein
VAELTKNKTTELVTIAVLVAVWTGIAVTAVDAIKTVGMVPAGVSAMVAAGISPNDTTVTHSLHLAAQPKPYEYESGFDSPFRPVGRGGEVAAGSGGPRAGAGYTRKTLSLKGILTKDNPLAILEDESGQTHIAGVGDTVESQKIVRIEATRVMLKDKSGSYELTVKE